MENQQEIWKPIAGWEETYLVSSFGKIKSLRNKRLLRSYMSSRYLRINLSDSPVRKTLTVSRLVAIAFIPNPNNLPEVNHKDGDRTNNHFDNLEWSSPKQNIAHSIITGLRCTKLKHSDIYSIRTMYAKDCLTQDSIALKFNISRQYVSKIILGSNPITTDFHERRSKGLLI